MTNFKLKIASRRSKLAMVQTLWVKEQLEKNIPNLEVSIEAMATQGDKILDVALAKIGDKGLFTKELEAQMLVGLADIENPEQDVSKTLLREDLEGVLATLSPRERDVLRLRYGIDDGRMKTLEEIGQIYDETRERIRQIEAKALRKLRHPNRNGVLKEYIK